MRIRRMRGAAALGALLVISGMIAVGCSTTVTNAPGGFEPIPAPSEREPAPDFSGFTSEGAQVSLSEYRGKPLVLAFMASW